MKVFTKGISVSGDLTASFCFESEIKVTKWLNTKFEELQKVHGPLTYNIFDLRGLRIGDTCFVMGEAAAEFKIIGLIKYSNNRYGFNLDRGWSEEVVKCF